MTPLLADLASWWLQAGLLLGAGLLLPPLLRLRHPGARLRLGQALLFAALLLGAVLALVYGLVRDARLVTWVAAGIGATFLALMAVVVPILCFVAVVVLLFWAARKAGRLMFGRRIPPQRPTVG